jgi:hypothetical protein
VGGELTFTVAVEETDLPVEFVTTSVYVVVTRGLTVESASEFTLPTVGVMTPVPPEKEYCNTAFCPLSMVLTFLPSPGGLAVNQAINGAGLPSPRTGPDPVQEISVNRATREIYIFLWVTGVNAPCLSRIDSYLSSKNCSILYPFVMLISRIK